MPQNLVKCFNVALQLAKETGQIIRELNCATNKQVSAKPDRVNLVTESDKKIEQILIHKFSSEFPDHKFIGEESVAAGQSCSLGVDPTWIIDPIDGTLNFIHSFPQSCISIALFVNREPKVGIVYNPILEQLFTAQKGKGAFLNEKPIKVSGQTELSKALLTIGNPVNSDPKRTPITLQNMKTLLPLIHGIRCLGSAALNISMVALGAADAYYDYGNYIWDIAAAELLITEAGGVIIDPAGGSLDRLSRRILCASSPELADKLSQKLIQYYPKRKGSP